MPLWMQSYQTIHSDNTANGSVGMVGRLNTNCPIISLSLCRPGYPNLFGVISW